MNTIPCIRLANKYSDEIYHNIHDLVWNAYNTFGFNSFDLFEYEWIYYTDYALVM